MSKPNYNTMKNIASFHITSFIKSHTGQLDEPNKIYCINLFT